MLTRRALLSSGLATFALACSREAKKSAAPSWPRQTSREGVDFIELFPHGATEESPILVAIHGRGDRPENWVDTYRSFPHAARIVLPRAFTPFGSGFSWFDLHDGMSDEELGAAVGAAETRLWKGTVALTGAKKIFVTGFSQGGILSFAIASRHADAVAYAFPVAGSCPGPLLPKAGAPIAPLVAFHGTADPVIEFRWGRAAVDTFKERGGDARLRAYPGVAHSMTAEMHADLESEITAAMTGASRSPARDK
mgnify:CR=1 FL=1